MSDLDFLVRSRSSNYCNFLTLHRINKHFLKLSIRDWTIENHQRLFRFPPKKMFFYLLFVVFFFFDFLIDSKFYISLTYFMSKYRSEMYIIFKRTSVTGFIYRPLLSSCDKSYQKSKLFHLNGESNLFFFHSEEWLKGKIRFWCHTVALLRNKWMIQFFYIAWNDKTMLLILNVIR